MKALIQETKNYGSRGSIHVLPLCCFLKKNHDAFVFAVCTPEINSISCLNAIRFAHVLYIGNADCIFICVHIYHQIFCT